MLHLLSQQTIDLLVVDVNLPGTGGVVQTQERLRVNEFRPYPSTCLNPGYRFTAMPEARLA